VKLEWGGEERGRGRGRGRGRRRRRRRRRRRNLEGISVPRQQFIRDVRWQRNEARLFSRLLHFEPHPAPPTLDPRFPPFLLIFTHVLPSGTWRQITGDRD
jgi:hypothetical protein